MPRTATLGKGHPQGAHRHDAAGRLPAADHTERDALLSSLVSTLDAAARVKPIGTAARAPDETAPSIANAIRDLLALDIDAAALLPPDDSSAASTTTRTFVVCRAAVESYLTAAERVSALALGDRDIRLPARSIA